MIRLFRRLTWSLAAIAAALLLVLLLVTPVRSLEFTPPDRGAPERIDAGGARFADFEREGDRVVDIVVDGEVLECPLTAILPPENYGLTIEAYPTVYVHIPDLAGIPVVFSLYDSLDRLVYQTRYLTGERHGTVGFSLPEHGNVMPLDFYRSYRWTLELPEQGEEVGGTLVRVALMTDFERQLAQAAPERQLELLAETGIWYDTIDVLAQLHRRNPDDPQWMQFWEDLMDAVDLMKVGDKPLL